MLLLIINNCRSPYLIAYVVWILVVVQMYVFTMINCKLGMIILKINIL